MTVKENILQLKAGTVVYVRKEKAKKPYYMFRAGSNEMQHWFDNWNNPEEYNQSKDCEYIVNPNDELVEISTHFTQKDGYGVLLITQTPNECMENYKKLIGDFLEDVEKLDMQCDVENLTSDDQQLLYIIRACRNKLAEVYNKIGDDKWVMPDMKLR